MKLPFACFAKFLDINPDGTYTIIGGGFSHLVIDTIPGVAPFLSVFLVMEVPTDECGLTYSVALRAIDPSKKKFDALSCEREFTPPDGKSDASKERRCILAFITSGTLFQEEGLYIVHVDCDGVELGKLELHIHQKSSQAEIKP